MPREHTSRAIVTGASRGIGLETACLLAADGYALALVSRSREALEAAATLCKQRGAPEVHVIPADLSDLATAGCAAKACVDALGGSTGVLVNAAGISSAAPISKESIAQLLKMFTVNSAAPFVLMQTVLAGMKAAKFGRVVNVASVAGLRGYPYIAAYAASKHALVGLTRVAAREYAAHGVTVNAVCPGYVDTEMTAVTIANISKATGRSAAEARAELEKISPQNRLFTPAEIAAAVVHLASRDAGGINGQCIAIDGGELA